uniref:Protein lethal(2)essential for life n=2 Tax=Culex pipiens TaxID=7175 RepID=A0A8D8PG37_CULPI
MSLVPVLFRDWWDDVWDVPLRSSHLHDQHFASGLMADDLLGSVTSCPRSAGYHHHHGHGHGHRRRSGYYHRPWRTAASMEDGGSEVNVDGERFQINLDVQQFNPDEISVRTVDDTVVIEGKHEEKEDEHGFVSRHFVRRYLLPGGYEPAGVSSSLSSEGILTVNAPKKEPNPIPANERMIPIKQTDEIVKGEKKSNGGDKKSTSEKKVDLMF